MRLICPNCSAQYEIDAGLIPEEGRDVQCSNCGNTWFELPAPAAEPSEAAEPDVAGLEDDVANETFEAAADKEPEAEPSTETPEDAPSEWKGPQKEDDDEWIETAVAPKEQKRPKDVAAVDILKEEASRELEQRKNRNLTRLETQSEFSLDPVKGRETPSRALRARMARMKSEDTGETDAPDESDYSAPRRDLLPDIEEINSSLGPAGGKTGPLEAQALRQQRRFRYGFFLPVIGAILAIGAYAWAPSIATALPGSEGPLLAYVDWANGARDALDRLIGKTGS